MSKTEITRIQLKIGKPIIEKIDKLEYKYNRLLNSETDTYHYKQWDETLTNYEKKISYYKMKLKTLDEIINEMKGMIKQ